MTQNRILVAALSATALAGLLWSQASGPGKTQIYPYNIAMPGSANGLLIGAVAGTGPTSAMALQLGPNFTINTSTAPYTLAYNPPSVTPTNQPIKVIGETYYPTATQPVMTLASGAKLVAGTVQAFRNGLRMAIPGDYSVSATGTVTFVNINIPQAGDTIVFDYEHN